MNLKDKVAECIDLMRRMTGIEKEKDLIIIQAGNNPASDLYIKSKMKEAEKWNVKCTLRKYEDPLFEMVYFYDFAKEMIKDDILTCNKNKIPIIVQLPVSETLNEQKIIDLISPELNVDGFHQTGREDFQYFLPCTPKGILIFLHYITTLKGKAVVVIGRGKTVGRPLVKMLLDEDCTVVECNSHTPESTLKAMLKQADIVVSAVGKPNLFNVDDLKEGCIVIDAGISRIDGKQVGDFSHEGDLSKVDYTPWTNGVGKLTVASLMMNVRSAGE